MERDRPTVLVTDADRSSAIAVIRSLGQIGCRVVAAGPRSHCAGFYSRYTAASFVYPSPQESPERSAAALLQAAADHHVDLLIPVTDDVIIPLDAMRDSVPSGCRLAIADQPSLRQAWDKRQTFDLAEQLGVPCPRSVLAIDSDAALLAAKSIGWPVVIKPIASRAVQQDKLHSFRVRYAANRDELERVMRGLEGSAGALIQELVGGVGRGVEVLAEHGVVRAAFQHRRLREVPVSGGVSSLRESEALDSQLLAHTQRLIEATSWTGLAMVEFKGDSKTPRLMEMNGRIWGSLPLAVKSGMDFPRKLWSLYDGTLSEELDTRFRIGVRCRNLMLDLRWAAEVLCARKTTHSTRLPRWRAGAVIVGLVSPRNRWDTWSVSDPLPGIFATGSSVKRLGGKAWGQLASRVTELNGAG